MNDLPRREPAPLYARPGRFEETLRRARKRRQRTAILASAAVVVICAGGVAGAMSLAGRQVNPQTAEPPAVVTSGLSNSGISGSGSAASTAPGSGPSAGPTSTGSAQVSAAHGPSTGQSGSVPPAQSNSQTGNSTAGKLYHGKVVDAAGHPLAQIGVYVEQNGRQVRVATTGSDGSFTIPVTTAPVLLAAGDFAGPKPAVASGQQNYAYTYVDASAVPTSSYAATVMNTGGQLSVTVTDPSGQPIAGSTEPELYCDASDTPCYTMTADASGKYIFSGLPTGDYTLRGTYAQHTYHVDAGQTTTVTWVEGQVTPPASPTGSPSPTPSTSQAPTSQGPGTQGPTTQDPSTQGPDGQGPDGGSTTAQSAGTAP